MTNKEKSFDMTLLGGRKNNQTIYASLKLMEYICSLEPNKLYGIMHNGKGIVIVTKGQIEESYIPNERLTHYMDVALENSKQYLKKDNKIRANEEYKRYKDLKDIVDDLVYHKTLVKGDK